MVNWFFQRLFLGGIHAYRFALGPFLGGHCRYEPTCSTFGLEAVREWGPWKGGWMTVKRIGRCHPWAKGGFDPVPVHAKRPGIQSDSHGCGGAAPEKKEQAS